MNSKFIGFIFLTSSWLLNGCQSTSTLATADIPDAQPASEEASEQIHYRNFTQEQLYELLVGELAGVRGDFAVALKKYADQAVETRDPRVVERAARIADYSNNAEKTLEMALLWSEVSPDNPTARRLAGISLARKGRFTEALPHAVASLQNDDSEPLMTLAVLAEKASPDQKSALLAQYQLLGNTLPENYWLVLTEAMLLRSSNMVDPALKQATLALKLNPDSESARLLKAQLEFQSGDKQQAIDTLEKGIEKHPESKRLQIQHIRFLAETDLLAAKQALDTLLDLYPGDTQLAFTAANSNFQLGLIDDARRGYLRLTRNPSTAPQAYYQLGLLEQEKNDAQKAIQYFREVSSGQFVVPAAARLSRLLAEKGEIETLQSHLQKLRMANPAFAPLLFQIESETLIEQQMHQHAYGLLNDALTLYPENIPLLYARSVAGEKLNNFSQAEADLRTIIGLDENNAMALNALGYTLTLHTTRYQEAMELIRKALEIEPEDPATLDSLGWVLFHLGRYDEAIVQLEKAMAKLPDPEIAAHLGEVYWVSGNPVKAREVWDQILLQQPDNPQILRTMERLQQKPTQEE